MIGSKIILWTTGLALSSLLITQSVLSLRTYLGNTTFLSLQLQDQKDAQTPTMTFCFPYSENETGIWEDIEYFYVRFFDFNFDLDNTNIKLTQASKSEDVNSMIQIRTHPFHGKCITLNNDRYKSSGLYYVRAK